MNRIKFCFIFLITVKYTSVLIATPVKKKMEPYSVKINKPRIGMEASPHRVTMVEGMTWGQRQVARKNMKKTMQFNPYERMNNQFVQDADLLSRKDQEHNEAMDNRSFYMNPPEDPRVKAYLREMGKYERAPLEGMSNLHDDLGNESVSMYERRVQSGMS
jgi:hypothetical protein